MLNSYYKSSYYKITTYIVGILQPTNRNFKMTFYGGFNLLLIANVSLISYFGDTAGMTANYFNTTNNAISRHLPTCASVSWSACARYNLSGPTMYCWRSNSASSLSSCSGVKIVLTLFDFPTFLLPLTQSADFSPARESP